MVPEPAAKVETPEDRPKTAAGSNRRSGPAPPAMTHRIAHRCPKGWAGAIFVRVKKLRVDVWSDIACPWCYVGKRRLEAALERFPHRDETEVVWRAFELDPAAPRERDRKESYVQRLANKYGSSPAEARSMIQRMTEIAARDGLAFDFERIRPGNTFDAHRVLHLASERGVQDAVKERFLRAYMTEGEPIGDPAALARLAGEAGLPTAEVVALLAGDRYRPEVRADEAEAHHLGIRGVPFFVLGGRYAVSGAQPAEHLLGALTEAWNDLESRPPALEEGAVCGPDGCA
jgi:predicted DsbA family dithiol-disulfide isomerase